MCVMVIFIDVRTVRKFLGKLPLGQELLEQVQCHPILGSTLTLWGLKSTEGWTGPRPSCRSGQQRIPRSGEAIPCHQLHSYPKKKHRKLQLRRLRRHSEQQLPCFLDQGEETKALLWADVHSCCVRFLTFC